MKIRFTKWPYGSQCAFTTSWDDGYTTDLDILRILEKNQVKGTFFISSKLIGEVEYLNGKQIQDIEKKGHEIGSHGKTHQKLFKMDDKQVLSNLRTSKSDIQAIIGKEVPGLSYPFGCFNTRTKELAKLVNYKYARTTNFGNISCPPRDWFEWNPSLMAQGRGGYRNKYLAKYIHLMRHRKFFTRKVPSWEGIIPYMFKNTYAREGLFHLWGHSRIVCKNNDLKKLDIFLANISSFRDIWVARNIDVFRYENAKRYASIKIKRLANKKNEIKIVYNQKIDPSIITLEIDKPNSSLTFKSDNSLINKRSQDKKLLVTFSPIFDNKNEKLKDKTN